MWASIPRRREAIRSWSVTGSERGAWPPQMTATEVIERTNEKGILLAPTIGRQQSEYLGPMIERELDRIAHVCADHAARSGERGDEADLDLLLGQRGRGDTAKAVATEGSRMLAAAGERCCLVALQVDGYPYADADRLLRADVLVVLDEVKSGDWGIAGNALTTADVHALAAGAGV